MYKLPEDFDLNALTGKSVSSICYGLNVITIFFSQDEFIQWSGHFKFSNGNFKCEAESIYPVTQDFGLLHLLETKILNAYTNPERSELNINFDNNSLLTLMSNDRYESFEIHLHEKRIII